MWLRRLELTDFRNIASLKAAFPPGVNLLLGDNAQGKTNLLEAIYLLALARPLRGEHEGDLIRWGSIYARVDAVLERRGGDLELGAVISRPDAHSRASKRLFLGGQPRRPADMVGQLKVVLFWPEDLRMVAGPPSSRRRFLDTILGQLDPRYRAALSRYGRVLEHRNATLRAMAELPLGAAGEAALRPWDAHLVAEGSVLAMKRAGALGRLGELARAAHTAISGGQEVLEVRYLPSQLRSGEEADASEAQPPEELAGWAAERWQSAFEARLRQRASAERARGQTLVGPHRDELRLLLDGRPAAAYASQGQQRSIALALKLAENRFMAEVAGEEPVLLLDDVMSELDAGRRTFLLESLQDFPQTFITAAGDGYFPKAFLRSAQRFHIRAGSLQAEAGD